MKKYFVSIFIPSEVNTGAICMVLTAKNHSHAVKQAQKWFKDSHEIEARPFEVGFVNKK